MNCPSKILIIGAGEFGIATALALLKREEYSNSQITIVDISPSLPNPVGSSVDASRIVRADYASAPYAALAVEAQRLWRDRSDDGWGGEGRYHEPGFVLTSFSDKDTYVRDSLRNVQELAHRGFEGIELSKIEELKSRDDIARATGYKGVSGESGYANWNSGWADAEATVAFALKKLKAEGGERVTLRPGAEVEELLFDEHRKKCIGARLKEGGELIADLTIVSAGAWSPSLVNLRGRCIATGQTLAYIEISEEERKAFAKRPTVINMSNGMFIIPPENNELKIARHGYGYLNPQNVKISTEKVSVPRCDVGVPLEGQQACRAALKVLLPEFADRPFTRTRICWYCDTPTGDFLITYHPSHPSLFLATGGSGHGFKFFPVIGERIADAIQGKLDPAFEILWGWDVSKKDAHGDIEYDENFNGAEDGSRALPKGMILEEELARK